MQILKKVINFILRKVSYLDKIDSSEKKVFLTFDDGPEIGITEFVLDELARFNFKATFFCCGNNAQKYPVLMKRIVAEGHTLGNHTYSHYNAYDVVSKLYVNDVEKADTLLHTKWFRPPYGCLAFGAWTQLRKKYKIVFWSLNSNDSAGDKFNFDKSFKTLTEKTATGEIVLFHFCCKHENETKQILSPYLNWLLKNGFVSKGL